MVKRCRGGAQEFGGVLVRLVFPHSADCERGRQQPEVDELHFVKVEY